MHSKDDYIEDDDKLEDYIDYSYAEITVQKQSMEYTGATDNSQDVDEYKNIQGTYYEHIKEDGNKSDDDETIKIVESIDEMVDKNKQKKLPAYAEEAQIKPTPVNLSSTSLEVEWTAHSETPITIFRVQFMANNASDWSEVDVTGTKLANEEWYGKADLLNLHPNTQYMVRVSSLNTEGYSKFSDAQMFTTSNKGQVKQDKITARSSPTISVSSLLCLVSLSSALISSEVLLK